MAVFSGEEVCQTTPSHIDTNYFSSGWFFTRAQIEDHSPSRRDGISLVKENQLRKSYCGFLRDLGMRLKVPQMTIATSILFCHRFFLRQSHAKNDRYTIATACMFLAGKVEETPKLLQNVLFISYEIRHKKDKSAANNIKQKEVYEYEKERVLLAENLVLQTLDFNINIVNPYRRLVAALKKLSIMDKFVVQVAWNFLNDSLQTSLCLQYEAHHIAAASIFLAAKFKKHKLPTDGGRQWWQELDVTVRQLEDMSNQMLELYEQRPSSVPSPTSTSGRILPTEVSPTQPPEGSCIKYKDRADTEIMDADSNGELCNLLQTPASSQKMNMEVSQIGSFDTHVQSKHPHQSCGSEDHQGRESKRHCSGLAN